MTKANLREKTDGEIWHVFGEKIICKVSGAETGGRFTLVEETSAPQSVVPPHFHHQTDEIVYVLEGEYEFEIDGRPLLAVKGDTVVIPRLTAHGFRNPLERESKFLAVVTPSGFENFFAEISRLSEPEMAEVVRIGRRNDLELVI